MGAAFDFSDAQNAWSAIQSTLVVAGFILVIWQIRIAREQNSISHLNHFRETWNSEPVLSARLKVCDEYPKSQPDLAAYDDIVAAFLEDLSAAVRVSQTNKDHAWSYFSYYVEIYWAMLGPSIKHYQSKINDTTYFRGFYKLHGDFAKIGARHGATIPDAKTMLYMIEEERSEVLFRIAHSTT